MPKMITWTDLVRYDINTDEHKARVSGFDDHHQEHWMMIEHGRGYRERRTEALTKIMESIEAGDPAGEVSAD
jgi:hypothetical protein